MTEKRRVYTPKEAIARAKTRPEMLVETLLPATGVALLAGEPGIGKSFFALNLAYSVGLRREFFGLSVNPGEERSNFAYVVGEGLDPLALRAELIELTAGTDTADVGKIIDFEGDLLTEPETKDELIEILDEQNPRFIVFDTFSSLFGVTSENDNAEVAKTMSFFSYVAKRYNATVLFVHHISKVGKTVRGASAFIGNVDTVIALRQGLSNPEKENEVRARGVNPKRTFFASTALDHGGKQRGHRECTHDEFFISPAGLLQNPNLASPSEKAIRETVREYEKEMREAFIASQVESDKVDERGKEER